MERRGERIAGSKLFRDFCAHCKTPIRVAMEYDGKTWRLPSRSYCEKCDGHKPPPLAANRPEGQGHGLSKTSG